MPKKPHIPQVEGNNQGRDFEDTTPDFPSSGAVIPWLLAAAFAFVALVAGWAVLG